MSYADTPAADERKLRLRYSTKCRHCSSDLGSGSYAFWDRTSKTARCLECPIPTQPLPPEAAIAVPEKPVDFGTAGASAQRLFDSKESKRRAHLRANWWAIAFLGLLGAAAGGWLAAETHGSVALYAALGAFLPVSKCLARPQHIAAWGIGASGERQVGQMLDGLRAEGVVGIHDRRVPGRRTNIDHIAVSPAGIFVIDTKNVAGKVTAGRSGVRVAGRRQDKMVTGVQGQVAVVRGAIADQGVDPSQVRGVLCFTKANLPWMRPSPGGVQLHYPRGLRKQLRSPGPLSPDQVQLLARILATRLPAA